jgi:hypothetical protein
MPKSAPSEPWPPATLAFCEAPVDYGGVRHRGPASAAPVALFSLLRPQRRRRPLQLRYGLLKIIPRYLRKTRARGT